MPKSVRSTALAVQECPTAELLQAPPRGPLEHNPAAVYLARVAPSSRRVMRSALDSLALLATGDEHIDSLSFDWTVLRYKHTSALRALLVDGVLRECWRLGYVAVEDYQRAVDLEPIRGSRLPRDRALEAGEIDRLFQACADDRPATSATRDAALLAVLASELQWIPLAKSAIAAPQTGAGARAAKCEVRVRAGGMPCQPASRRTSFRASDRGDDVLESRCGEANVARLAQLEGADRLGQGAFEPGPSAGAWLPLLGVVLLTEVLHGRVVSVWSEGGSGGVVRRWTPVDSARA